MTEQDKQPPGEPGRPEPSTTEAGQTQLETSHEARNMAMLCHIFGAVGFIGPLMIWLSEREKHRFVAQHGQATINYQISLIIYFAACWLLAWIWIGIPLMWLLSVAHVVLVIVGAVKAHRGESWRYPIAIDFVK